MSFVMLEKVIHICVCDAERIITLLTQRTFVPTWSDMKLMDMTNYKKAKFKSLHSPSVLHVMASQCAYYHSILTTHFIDDGFYTGT